MLVFHARTSVTLCWVWCLCAQPCPWSVITVQTQEGQARPSHWLLSSLPRTPSHGCSFELLAGSLQMCVMKSGSSTNQKAPLSGTQLARACVRSAPSPQLVLGERGCCLWLAESAFQGKGDEKENTTKSLQCNIQGPALCLRLSVTISLMIFDLSFLQIYCLFMGRP